MYVCIYVYICMYVCMYECMYSFIHSFMIQVRAGGVLELVEKTNLTSMESVTGL
jgi:hypothetical protein